MATLLLLALSISCVHIRFGMQVIIEDYVHSPLEKTMCFVATIGVTGALAVLEIAIAG